LGIKVQYHEVKINLELRNASDCYWAGTSATDPVASPTWITNLDAVKPGSLQQPSLFVDYIYLDTDERRRFAQVSHEYLIEQLQFTGDESTSQIANKFKMSFNHPVKELVWIVRPDDYLQDGTMGKQWFNFTDDQDVSSVDMVAGGSASGGSAWVSTATIFGKGENPVDMAKIQLNGHDRFSERDGRYFNLVQPYQHHENVPSKGINVYSFALQPESHQPSGTCNMSRIDNATLNLTLTPKSVSRMVGSTPVTRSCSVKIFCVNYNVLRVMSGMGKHRIKILCEAAHNSRLPSGFRFKPGLDKQYNRLVDAKVKTASATFPNCGKLLEYSCFQGCNSAPGQRERRWVWKKAQYWMIRTQASTHFEEGSENRWKWGIAIRQVS
jgi:hypothetical protein